MTSSVVKFYPQDAAKDPNNVLEQAINQYESVIVLGWDKEGFLDARASTNLSHEQVLWIISKFTHKLLNGDYAGEDDGEE